MYSARLSLLFTSVRRTELLTLNPDVLARQESCRQKILREVLSEEFLLYQQPDESPAEHLSHLLEPGERNENEPSLLVEAPFQHQAVMMVQNADGILPAVPGYRNCRVHSAAVQRMSDAPHHVQD